MSTETLPERFEDLKPTELYRSAIEDFALPVEVADKNKKAVLLAAFLEGGVVWADYVAQHPEVVPEPVTAPEPVGSESLRAPEPAREGSVITSPSPVEAGVIRVAERPVYNPNDKLLIKMDRKNPLFETRGHRFTTENPYALMSPTDADYVLRHEEGFRQALPSELAEFYG